jgi:hypothetical protein
MSTSLNCIFGALARGAVVALVVVGAAVPLAASAQKAFPTPEAAADALIDGVARSDPAALKGVLGAGYAKQLPVREASDDEVTSFLAASARYRGIARRDDRTAFLEIGDSRWPLPIPIVRSAAGWSFDPAGTADELRTRRIGRNEMTAIKSALAYADAQAEYFQADPDGDGVKAYAAKLFSSKGRRDGLYWPSLDDEAESPLGPLIGAAQRDKPYYGYLYRVLTAQGAAAPGGAKDYFRNGRMTEGFALVAWPAKYGDSGVMTFIVNRDGIVYEKDLGPRTDAVARAMKAYDPDAGWKKSDLAD